MEIDDAIVQLGEKLDEWFDNSRAPLASQDPTAQAEALFGGYKLVREFDRLKADGLAAIKKVLNRRDRVATDERIASLIQAFEFAGKLQNTLHEFMDSKGEMKVQLLMIGINKALEDVGVGRAALAILLDSPDARVRVSACRFLINSMPDRVLPIVHEISKNEGNSSAGLAAYWLIRGWEVDHRADGK